MTQLTDQNPEQSLGSWFNGLDADTLDQLMAARSGNIGALETSRQKIQREQMSATANQSKQSLAQQYKMFKERLQQLELPELEMKQRQQELDAWMTREAHRLQAAQALRGPENYAQALSYYRGQQNVGEMPSAFAGLTDPTQAQTAWGGMNGLAPTPLSEASLDRLNGSVAGPMPATSGDAALVPGVTPAAGTIAADSAAVAPATPAAAAAAPAVLSAVAPTGPTPVGGNMGTSADTTSGQPGLLGQPFSQATINSVKTAAGHANQWDPRVLRSMSPAEQASLGSMLEFTGNDPGSVLQRARQNTFKFGAARAA